MADPPVLDPPRTRPKPTLCSTAEEAPRPHADGLPVAPTPNAAAQVAISEQAALTKAQAAGIKAVEHLLLANNGGIPSGTPLPSASPSHTEATQQPVSSIQRLSLASGTAEDATRGSTTPPPDSQNVSTYDHFKMKDSKSTTAKAIADRTAKNVAILADAVRMLETDVHRISHDISNLTVEVRLRPGGPPFSPSDGPTSWRTLYGVNLERPSSASAHRGSRSRSHSSERLGSDVMGQLEELKFQTENTRNDLNARILALERRESVPRGMTVDELQKATVQRFAAVTKDLNVLNNEIYQTDKEHGKATAALKGRLRTLEDANENLHTQNIALRAEQDKMRADLSAVTKAIARLEVVATPPLALRSRSPQRALPRIQALPRRSSPPSRYLDNRAPPRSRSHSPSDQHPPKRARTEETHGFISFGPLDESADPDSKRFELHLRTAICSCCGPREYNKSPPPFSEGPARRAGAAQAYSEPSTNVEEV
ncbi:hypothetical protein FB451DRAFT_1405465 [Mycena latifolia]|nr:hypothetical protein FB451DRAFT_1405465 [Mycena latifolia]